MVYGTIPTVAVQVRLMFIIKSYFVRIRIRSVHIYAERADTLHWMENFRGQIGLGIFGESDRHWSCYNFDGCVCHIFFIFIIYVFLGTLVSGIIFLDLFHSHEIKTMSIPSPIQAKLEKHQYVLIYSSTCVTIKRVADLCALSKPLFFFAGVCLTWSL